MKALLPPHETERLETLRRYEILDTPPEEAYDDLTLLAAHICEMPMAVVSLIDENRQWFKSRVGITPAELSRDIAFCAHALLHADEVLEVCDALRDSRFSDNPLVTADGGIRYYAGAPLVAPDGHALGTLCVLDRRPRKLSTEQVGALRALGRRVVAQLELGRLAKMLLASERETRALLAASDKSRRALLGLVEDQKQVETALRSSEERFRQIAENIHEVFWMTDVSKNEILYVSPAYETIWGRPRKTLYDFPRTWSESIHPEDRERVIAAAATKQNFGAYDEIYRVVRPDGAIRWVRNQAFPVKDADGQVERVVGVAEDITERKAAELRVGLQHTVTRILAEGATLSLTVQRMLEAICRQMAWTTGGFWRIDRPAGLMRPAELWHPASAEFTPFADATRAITLKIGEGLPGKVWKTGKPVWIAEVAQDASFCRAAAAAGISLRGGVGFPIQLRGEMLGVLDFFSGESRAPDPEMLALFEALGVQLGQFIERQQLADQFREAQKMEAIGTLAGGIAHDFNNVLAAINGYTELAKWETADNPKVTEYLGAVLQGAKRATDLVRQILTFSRRQEMERKPIQLRAPVEEALKLLRATIPSTVEFSVKLPSSAPNVLADATQVHQVVMNLCTNAAHAMMEQPGRLTVVLENLSVNAEFSATLPGLHPGSYLRLSIGDTGCGMDEATQSRIFEPFFTTKGPGEGTGLGLAVVHGIMQSHDGAVSLVSRPGEGTTFYLYFPALRSAEAVATPKITEIPCGRGQRILFVDDETMLAKMGKQILERLGYAVDARTSALDALGSVRAKPQEYDLVITDYMMPAMTGTALAEQIRAIRSDLPVILTTGYSATLTAERAHAMGIQKLLAKPVSVEAMATAVFNLMQPTKSK